MKRIFFLMILFAAATNMHAQTKAIAYKSHSGSAANYAMALKNDPALKYDAGFGLPSHRSYHFIKEVRYLSPNSAILFSAVYLGDFIKIADTSFVKNVFDTITNDAIFYKTVPMDSLKKVLQSRYKFDNNFDKVKFIGFDFTAKKQRRKKTNKNEAAPIIVTGSISSGHNNTIEASQPVAVPVVSVAHTNLPDVGLSLFLKLAIFSGLVGWLAWKLYQPLYRHSV